MSAHLWQVVTQRSATTGLAKGRPVMYARCSCGWIGDSHTTHGQAEAEARAHEEAAS